MSTMAKDSELFPAGAAASGGSRPEESAGRTQPVALEVAVTVNGARTVEGSDKREPFSETTKTVLIFASGAVIRLSSTVAPGQLLFLTNENTKKEVVCQVVKSRNYSSASGYVELEFTEPASAFWGMRFPAERPAALQANSMPAKTTPSAQRPAAPSSPALVGTESQSALPSRPQAKVEAPPQAEPSADTETLKREAARLQEQLSGVLFAENSGSSKQQEPAKPAVEAKGKVIEMVRKPEAAEARPNPAIPTIAALPAQAAFQPRPDLTAGEVGIPSWLEPLARNASIPAPAEPQTNIAETVEALPAPEDSAAPSYADVPGNVEPVSEPAISSDISTPTFGSQIFGDEHTGEFDARKRKSGKGLLVGLLAAGIIAAAGGAWYFKPWQPSSAQALAGPPVFATLPAPDHSASASAAAAQEAAPRSLASEEPVSRSSGRAAAAEPLRGAASENPPAVVNAREKERIESTRSLESRSAAARNDEVRTAPAESVESPKKPTLGDVKLAAPTLSAKAADAENVAAPHFGAGTPGAGDPADTGLIAANSAEPAAPVPVGGDVKSARLLHAVPPVYPPIAKSQRIAGDVKMDALVDGTGHVTAMKIVSGPVLLHQAAKDAVKQWRYQPAMLDGKPVPMHLTVTVQFRLQ